MQPDPGAFDNPIRRSENAALHEELLGRLRQHGVTELRSDEPDAVLADLLSAADAFEAAVERAGGDLFVDSPDSSEPERPDFVLPHIHQGERAETYLRRVREATARLERLDTGGDRPVSGL